MQRTLTHLIAITVISLAIYACQLPEGPAGPAGEPGDQGEQGLTGEQGSQGAQGIQGEKGDQGDIGASGPGTRITFTGQLDTEGAASIALPIEAGSLDDPPLVVSYYSESIDGPYGAYLSDTVLDGENLDFVTATILINLGDHLAVGLGGPGLANWYYRLVVTY